MGSCWRLEGKREGMTFLVAEGGINGAGESRITGQRWHRRCERSWVESESSQFIVCFSPPRFRCAGEHELGGPSVLKKIW